MTDSVAATPTRWQGFLVEASGRVSEIEEDGEYGGEWQDDDLYAELLFAGYPLSKDTLGGSTDFFDLAVDPTDLTHVIAYTTGDEPREHRIEGAAAAVLLGWYVRNA